ncbi:MAG TPA: hypothetical protein VEY12_04610 [Thermoplasmata archaeon]|nr:hypothetical protein [Thermoplasmata archaeon]
MNVLSRAEPVYRDLKGWPELSEEQLIDIAKRGTRGLPEAPMRYLRASSRSSRCG